ncbi:MAG TPA: LD-carboxypeptidase [Acidobacteriaceae bacterium]
MSTPVQLRPRALRAGARLAVVSPASAVKAELVQKGMAALVAMGYEPVLFPHALARGPIYYAGSTQERADDLQSAFSDKSIDGVICTRGGWGSAELLPLLDAKVFRENPKPFIGYSDHSALHTWLQNEAGLGTFYGPMVASDFGREGGVDTASWTSALSGDADWELGEAEGLRVMQRGAARGVLRGGCLSILVETLGTKYAFEAKDSILFLEDIGHKPYQWDRQLLHLRYAGVLDSVRGIVFGDMAQCVTSLAEAEKMEQVLRYALRGFPGPVMIGLRSGHVNGANVTLPLGVEVEMDLSGRNPRLHFLEAAVSG